MKKIIVIASLIATPAFAQTTIDEDPATNTVTIENTVDVYSSRQNVWVCDVSIQNRHGNVGSDNRVYFTAIESNKGRNTNPSAPMNRVLEAPVDGSVVRASSLFANSYFNSSKEVKISNIRVELASLNYGAMVRVEFCGELPFSYYRMPENPCRRSYDLDVTATHKYLDLLRTSDYITAADLKIATNGNYTGEKDTANPWLTTISGNTWYDMATDYSTHSSNGNLSSGTNLDFVTLTSPSSSFTWEFIDVAGGDADNQRIDVNKWAVGFTLAENAGTLDAPVKRLKGLTEGVKWQQHLSSKLDIYENELVNGCSENNN